MSIAAQLHNLWPIAEPSFKLLVESRLKRIGHALVLDRDAAVPALDDNGWSAPDFVCARSVGIESAASHAYAWLAQMMRGAGIYGWSRLESADCRSMDALAGELPPPRAGDRVGNVLVLVRAGPEEELVWRSAGPLRVFGHSITSVMLAYRLTPLAETRCRLEGSLGCRCRHLTNRVARHLLDTIDLVLLAPQLENIRRLAELARQRDAAPSARVALTGVHQVAPFQPAGTGQSLANVRQDVQRDGQRDQTSTRPSRIA